MEGIYNYQEAIKADIIEWIKDNIEWIKENVDTNDNDEMYEFCVDHMYNADSVTGNASGSYTFSTYTAKTYVLYNVHLFFEAGIEWGVPMEEYLKHFEDEEWEYMDVTIRCYLLPEILTDVINNGEF